MTQAAAAWLAFAAPAATHPAAAQGPPFGIAATKALVQVDVDSTRGVVSDSRRNHVPCLKVLDCITLRRSSSTASASATAPANQTPPPHQAPTRAEGDPGSIGLEDSVYPGLR